MALQEFYFVIADISGYTKFVTAHRESLMHAERIIGNLLETIIACVRPPLEVHELMGDAVVICGAGERITADEIYHLMTDMHHRFVEAESNHVSRCSLCSCAACTQVGQLRLKIIAHRGHAVRTIVGGRQKISGEDVIEVHRWLKNGIPSNEYYLLTEAVYQDLAPATQQLMEKHAEQLEGLGIRTAFYQTLNQDMVPVDASFGKKLARHVQLNVHGLLRRLGKRRPPFLHLPESQS